MPINIDFYLLPNPTIDSCGHYICRLVEKAYLKGHQVFIYTAAAAETKHFDSLLWTFRDISFVPHHNAVENPTLTAPIQISHQPPADQHDLLLNLTNEVPTFYPNFSRILEIVPSDQDLKTAGRKKYKYYQQQDLELALHEIRN